MAVAAEGPVTVGIDVGGSKIAGGLVRDDGTLADVLVVPTFASRGAGAVVAELCELIDGLRGRARDSGLAVRGVGVATAGLVDRHHGVLAVSTQALPGFSGLAMRERLELATSLPVSVLNDVHAMALGEQRFGVGQGAEDVLYVAVGTGVGGAITRNGELLGGAHGSAGDIGHVLVERSSAARLCPCGRRGHLEAYVSGPALAASYEDRSGLQDLGGDLRPVVQRALGGEDVARSTIREGAELLGRAVGGVANLLDPELVVFGGGLIELSRELFWDLVVECLQAEIRGRAVPRAELARLGKDAAVVGAAVYAAEAHREQWA